MCGWSVCVCVVACTRAWNIFTSVYIDFKRSLGHLIVNVHRTNVYLSLGMGHNVGEQTNEGWMSETEYKVDFSGTV